MMQRLGHSTVAEHSTAVRDVPGSNAGAQFFVRHHTLGFLQEATLLFFYICLVMLTANAMLDGEQKMEHLDLNLGPLDLQSNAPPMRHAPDVAAFFECPSNVNLDAVFLQKATLSFFCVCLVMRTACAMYGDEKKKHPDLIRDLSICSPMVCRCDVRPMLQPFLCVGSKSI
uniref:Uncharacterized protein n=1 Tax=Syphacia muris TaxID=451379 RepID=A0A0N5AC52_9BILA